MRRELEDFEAALAKGSGRAMHLLMQAADRRPFEDALVHACLHDLAYDPQCEHERSEYLARLIVETGDQERLFFSLVPRMKARDVDVRLLFTVLARLAAKSGEPETSAVRQAYAELDADAQVDCMDALVRLDGLPAFIQSAVRLDTQLGREFWRVGGLLEALKEHDEASFDRSITSARERHPSVEKLLAHYENDNRSVPVLDRRYDLTAIRAELRSGKRLRGVIFRNITDADWRRICDDFMLQEQDELALPYLTLFRRRPFAGNPAGLIRWMNASNARVSSAAARALGRVTSPIVRDMALSLIRSKALNGVRLLASNYRSGDLDLVLPMLRDLSDVDEVHDLGLALLNVIHENDASAEDSTEILLLLYERTPCSACRAEVVSRLVEGGRAPAWMADECRFDSDPATVRLFAAD